MKLHQHKWKKETKEGENPALYHCKCGLIYGSRSPGPNEYFEFSDGKWKEATMIMEKA